MIHLLALLPLMIMSLNINFNTNEVNDWRVVNDGVMGGLSKGVLTYNDSTVVFRGALSLANNGGFASFQSPLGDYDLSEYKTVSIRHRGSGGTFGFRLKTSEPFYLPYYKVQFTPREEWQVSTFELKDFDEWRLSDKTGNKITKTDLSGIIRMGIIKSDKKEGPFVLEVDQIRFE